MEKFCKIPCETKLAIETNGFSAFMNTIYIKLVFFLSNFERFVPNCFFYNPKNF
jgi:hypothetical protein